MDSQLLAGALFFLLVPTFATSGAVALLFVWFPRLSFGARVLVATIGTPIMIFAPVFAVFYFDRVSVQSIEWLVAIAMIAIPSLLFGWPIAHFLSRALDRRSGIDKAIFE